ncbi:hypothetical protein ACFX19_041497 [Malus domestica]
MDARKIFSAAAKSRGLGGLTEDLWHQLRVADQRARLKIMKERSSGGGSGRAGVKLRDLQLGRRCTRRCGRTKQ